MKKLIIFIRNTIEQVITNPSVYVAAVVGALIGGGTGGAIGLISGGFIGYTMNLCQGCQSLAFAIPPSITTGALPGAVLGAAVGGGVTGLISIYKVHLKTQHLRALSHKTITAVLVGSFWVSAEIAIGMALGAIVGSLKSPGFGSLIGALVGLLLMLFTASLERRPKK